MRLVLFCRHSDLVQHLEAEVAFWRMQFAHERQRAERAVDTLLALKLNVPPITVPTPEERSAAEREIETLARDPEFVQAGLA